MSPSASLLTFAPAALATSHGGEGWYGETSDTVITNVMFMTIIFFPTVIIIFSLIQWRLDKRKHARMAAAKPAPKRRLARWLVSRTKSRRRRVEPAAKLHDTL